MADLRRPQAQQLMPHIDRQEGYGRAAQCGGNAFVNTRVMLLSLFQPPPSVVTGTGCLRGRVYRPSRLQGRGEEQVLASAARVSGHGTESTLISRREQAPRRFVFIT